jgi:hypothetical protein
MRKRLGARSITFIALNKTNNDQRELPHYYLELLSFRKEYRLVHQVFDLSQTVYFDS